jgi:hypothetical protein
MTTVICYLIYAYISILFINILYYKNKFIYIYIYIYKSSLNKRVDPYTSGFTSFNRVKSSLYKFISFNNQSYFHVHERLI